MNSEPAFVIKQAVGALLWSPSDGSGQFTSLELSEVVMNTKPALELLRTVGSDGFSMLFTLAAAASVDDAGQLVVVGGVERLRALMNWKRDKAQRVFRDLLDAGFVARSQGSTIGNDGRRHFVATVLVLHPQLYRPEADSTTSSTATGATGSGQLPTSTSLTATAHSGSGTTGSVEQATPSAAGRSGSGDEIPAHTAADVSGSGTTGSVHDMNDDEKEHSSSSNPGDAAALVSALRSLGFADADRIVATTERTMLIDALQYVLTSTSSIANPGAYLRRLLRSGGVKRPARDQLALELASTLQPVRVSTPPAGSAVSTPPAPDDDSSISDPSTGFDAERLNMLLNELDTEHRERLEREVDNELASVPEKFRRHETVFAAMRRYQLAKLVGLVNDE